MHANIALESGKIVTVPVTVRVPVLGGYKGEIVDLGGAVGLVVAPPVSVRVSPLGRVEGEIVDALSSQRLIVTPSVPVRIEPLRWFEREGVRTVVDGPVFIPVGVRVQVAVNASKPVGGRTSSDERAGIRLCGVVDKLTDVPDLSRGVQRRIVPVVAVAVLVGVVPLRGVVSKGVGFANRVGEPRFVAVQSSRVRVGVRVAIGIHAPVPVGRGVASTELTVVALVAVEVVPVAVVVRVQPL